MNSTTILALLVFLTVSPSATATWFKCCSEHTRYTQECLDITQPPDFVKFFDCFQYWECKSCDYYTLLSLVSAKRCCNIDDLSDCHCPKKDTDSFLDKMFGPKRDDGSRTGGWCADVAAACPTTFWFDVVEEKIIMRRKRVTTHTYCIGKQDLKLQKFLQLPVSHSKG